MAASGERGMAITKLIIVLSIVLLLGSVGSIAYVKFINKAHETTAISYLEMIRRAQGIYKSNNEMGIFSNDFDHLEITGFIPRSTGDTTRLYEDYKFTLNTGTPPDNWFVNAEPADGDKSLKRFYISSNSDGIHYEIGVPASGSSPTL
jgi:type II secretory pathway pseudopilin PulG